MFDIGMGEFLGLAVVALLVLGPDKLPKFAADAAKFIRQVRRMANTAREDVRREIGPELQGISLDDLNPRNALRKHVLDDLDLDAEDDDERSGTTVEKGAPTKPQRAAAPYDPDTT
jgi:sec-independent protein translocase protein TatB